MGYFSSITGKEKHTKYSIACRIAALIWCTREDIGMNAFLSGSIVLNGDWSVSFRGGGGRAGAKDNINIVVVAKLFELFKEDTLRFFLEPNVSRSLIEDRITFAVINEFEKKSNQFSSLSALFPPVGNYVFVGKSAKFRDVERLKNNYLLCQFFKQNSESCYLLESFTSMGLAKVREKEVEASRDFSGGVVDSYELQLF